MSLKRNTFFNLLGKILPMAVSLVTVPLYLHYIGEARYGVLAIVWTFLGYFGVFDFGLSRAAANQIAKLSDAPADERQSVFWTAFWLNALFGLIGALVLYLFAAPLLTHFFMLTEEMQAEVLAILPWIAASVPMATLSAVACGTLEGRERFFTVNALQLFGTVLFQVAPLLAVITWGAQLDVLIPTAIAGRGFSSLLFLVAAFRSVPVRAWQWPDKKKVNRLMNYGAWVSVTGLISPMLDTLDRMLIGNVLGTEAVARYSVPFTLVEKFRVFPGAIARALFPRFSQLSVAEARLLAAKNVTVLSVLMTALLAPAQFLIAPFLQLWVGPALAAHATPVAQIILLGLWLNSLAHIPAVLLPAQGRPDLAAKFHALEFLPFIALLWCLLQAFGLIGAAMAWSIRVALDAMLLFWAAKINGRQLIALLPFAALLILAFLMAQTQALTPFQSLSLAIAFFAMTVTWGVYTNPTLIQPLWKLKTREQA